MAAKRRNLVARLRKLGGKEITGTAFLTRMLESRIPATMTDLKKLSSLAKEIKNVKSSDEVDAAEKIVYSAVVHAGWILNECTSVLEALVKDPKKARYHAAKIQRKYRIPD
jgi:hypothetical protein